MSNLNRKLSVAEIRKVAAWVEKYPPGKGDLFFHDDPRSTCNSRAFTRLRRELPQCLKTA